MTLDHFKQGAQMIAEELNVHEVIFKNIILTGWDDIKRPLIWDAKEGKLK